jgi:hypothetical protein
MLQSKISNRLLPSSLVVERHPDTRRDVDGLAVKLESLPEGVQQTRGHDGRLLSVLDVFQQQNKIVVAEVRHRVADGERALHLAGHLAHQTVRQDVSEAGGDRLHPLDFHRRDREDPRLRPHALKSALDPVHQQDPVGQAGQRIVDLAVGNVRLGSGDPAGLPGLVALSQAPAQHPPVGPLRVQDPVLALEMPRRP